MKNNGSIKVSGADIDSSDSRHFGPNIVATDNNYVALRNICPGSVSYENLMVSAKSTQQPIFLNVIVIHWTIKSSLLVIEFRSLSPYCTGNSISTLKFLHFVFQPAFRICIYCLEPWPSSSYNELTSVIHPEITR